MREPKRRPELPGFRFSLQSVLDVKVRVEEQLQAELAALLRMRDELHLEAEALRSRAADAARVAQQASTGVRLDVTSVEGALAYSARLQREAEQAAEALAMLCTRADVKRKELQRIMQERKTLDQLREDGLEREACKRSRHEAKMLDEMAVMRFGLWKGSESERESVIRESDPCPSGPPPSQQLKGMIA